MEIFKLFRTNGEWRQLKETNGGHLHGAATVFKDRIYVAGKYHCEILYLENSIHIKPGRIFKLFFLGGLHTNDFINRTVEVYEPVSDSWSNVAILPTPIYAHGLITLTRET